jgi:hypothetical protein
MNSEQENAAGFTLEQLRGYITTAKAMIYAGKVGGIGGSFGATDVALANLDHDSGRIDQLEAELEQVRAGDRSWTNWVDFAGVIASDIETQAGVTGPIATWQALKEIPADTKQTVNEYINDAKNAAPYVAAGVSGILVLGIALFLWVEFRRRS